MFESPHDLTDHESGREGCLRIAVGMWRSDTRVFAFDETGRGIAGTITSDWRHELPLINAL